MSLRLGKGLEVLEVLSSGAGSDSGPGSGSGYLLHGSISIWNCGYCTQPHSFREKGAGPPSATTGVMCDTITVKVEPESPTLCCHMPHGRKTPPLHGLRATPTLTYSSTHTPLHTHKTPKTARLRAGRQRQQFQNILRNIIVRTRN